MPGVDIIGLIQFPNVFNLIIVTYSWLYCDFQIRSTKRKLIKEKNGPQTCMVREWSNFHILRAKYATNVLTGGTWLNLMEEQSYVSLFITLDTYPFLDGLPKTKIFMVWVQSIPTSSESATPPPLSALSVFISVPFKRCQWLMILQKTLEGKRVQCKSLGRENKQSPKTHPILHG